MRLASPQVGELEALQHLIDSCTDLGRGSGEVLESESDIFLDMLRNELILRILKEHAHGPPCGPTTLISKEIVSGDAGLVTTGRLGEPTKKSRQGRLAGPVRTDHGEELALIYPQVETGQGVRGGAGIAKVESDYVDDASHNEHSLSENSEGAGIHPDARPLEKDIL